MDDEQIGANVARLRGNRSQKDVADAMKSLGFKWGQSTVSEVEAGRRPLKMIEAYALSVVLDVGAFGVDSFMRSDAGATFRAVAREMVRQDLELRKSMHQWWRTQFELALASDSLLQTEHGMSGHEAAVADNWTTRTMEDVLNAAWANERADGIEEMFAEDFAEGLAEGTTLAKNTRWADGYHEEVALDPKRRFEAQLHRKRYGERPQAS